MASCIDRKYQGINAMIPMDLYRPLHISDLSTDEPNYKNFEGWGKSTTGIKSFEKLPEKMQHYIQFISDFIGVPVKIISIGPGRDEIIHID